MYTKYIRFCAYALFLSQTTPVSGATVGLFDKFNVQVPVNIWCRSCQNYIQPNPKRNPNHKHSSTSEQTYPANSKVEPLTRVFCEANVDWLILLGQII